ncbi:MAG: outer membrane protein [Mariniblastus sp.]
MVNLGEYTGAKVGRFCFFAAPVPVVLITPLVCGRKINYVESVVAMETVVLFSPFHNFIAHKTILAILGIGLMLCSAAISQEISRYPLGETRQETEKSQASRLQFQPLPMLQDSPTLATRIAKPSVISSSLEEQFNLAYAELDSVDTDGNQNITPLPSHPNDVQSNFPSEIEFLQTDETVAATVIYEPGRPARASQGSRLDLSLQSFNPAEQSQSSPHFSVAASIGNHPDSIQPDQLSPNDFLVAESNVSGDPIWWKQKVLDPIHSPASIQSVDTNGLVYQTLQGSPRIRALSQSPLIREQQIIEADSDFDPTSFVRSQFQDRVDPVGDSLSITADGSDFLEDHIWSGEFGIRRKTRTGASFEVGQTLGFKNSNSNFFVPQDQGTATLALNVTQPLLRGRGKYYNQSQILIAQSTGAAAWDSLAGEIQDEIQKTVRAYWQLYFDRSVYLQKQRNVERGVKLLQLLEGRAGLDSLPSQITRARSAVQSRKTDLANALRDIRNSETELRRLTADRNWLANQSVEMIPVEAPTTLPQSIELDKVVLTALENRPEIKETMKRAKIAGIQKNISVNDLLPELSFLMGTYVSALQGESQLGQAIQDQFGAVKPGYSVGIEFEMPIHNRAAKSRFTQRKLQLIKIQAEVDDVMRNVIAESQVAHRRITSAIQTIEAALLAILAANADLEQNLQRWESFALIEGDLADGQSPTTVLDQLLDSQERLTAAELVFTLAELELKTAEVGLKRTMGTLLIHQNVGVQQTRHQGTPQVQTDHLPAAR